MKDKYLKPEIEKLEFEQCDILTNSPTNSNGIQNNENNGESGGDYNF